MIYRNFKLLTVIAAILMLSYCSKKEEISAERFKVLADTLAQDLEYGSWMDFAYELAKNYPEEYMSGMVMAQAAERAIMEQDAKRFDKFFELLKNYPAEGALEMTDQIAIGNRLAWIMSSQMLLTEKSTEVINFAIEKFIANEAGLQWRDELGAMLYDTQAVIYEGLQDTARAMAAYNQAVDYLEQPETLLRRGLLLEAGGNLEAALEDYIAALGHSPNEAMLIHKVQTVFSLLNPDEDAVSFMVDLQESLQERRKEEVLSEVFSNDAPEFQFTDFSGQQYSNSNMLGKVFFVDFWATWCNPCRRELPEFQAFYDRYKDHPRVAFIAASTDSERNKVKPFMEEMNFSFPVAFAEGAAAKFGVEGIPSLFIIGPEGKIRYKIVGFDPDKDFVREMTWRLESLLDG